MTQDELGKRAELHSTWISNIECGKVNPTWGNSRRLAYALGVTVPYLASLAEKMEVLRMPRPRTVRTVRRRRLGKAARGARFGKSKRNRRRP